MGMAVFSPGVWHGLQQIKRGCIFLKKGGFGGICSNFPKSYTTLALFDLTVLDSIHLDHN